MTNPEGFVSNKTHAIALEDLANAQMREANLRTALESIRSMVKDDSGHNMQKVGTITQTALDQTAKNLRDISEIWQEKLLVADKEIFRLNQIVFKLNTQKLTREELDYLVNRA